MRDDDRARDGAADRDLAAARALRVLIVEDESLVAMHLEDLVAELGHEIAASAGGFDEALAIAPTIAADVALLDVNLGRRDSYPVAEILAARGVPVIFTSGYGEGAAKPPFERRPVVGKPFTMNAVRAAIDRALDTPE